MTNEETKQAIAVMQGYVDGKTIEFSSKEGDNVWYDALNPVWNFSCLNYRIKPEPHYRPFKSADEVMEAIKEHGDWIIDRNGTMEKILSISANIVCTRSHYFKFGEAHYLLVFLGGTPFGKLVEER